MHTPTFNDILRRVERETAARLMDRAALANRLAKTAVNGAARRHAYRVKTDALRSLKTRFPQRVSVRRDEEIPLFVIVEYADPLTNKRFGLHAPAAEFSTENIELALEK